MTNYQDVCTVTLEDVVSLSFRDPQLSNKIQPLSAGTSQGRVEYADFGRGKTVVTLHGAMGGYDQSLILAHVIGGAEYRYLAVSRPGYLGTPINSGKTPEQQGDLIAALLDALSVDKAGVFAVSGGGPCAVEFGLRHPDRCSGLVLVATNAEKVNTPIPFSFKIMMAPARSRWFVDRFRKKAEQNLEAAAARSIQDAQILQRTINDADAWPLFCALMLSTYNRMHERLVGTDNDIRITGAAECALEKISAHPKSSPPATIYLPSAGTEMKHSFVPTIAVPRATWDGGVMIFKTIFSLTKSSPSMPIIFH